MAARESGLKVALSLGRLSGAEGGAQETASSAGSVPACAEKLYEQLLRYL